MAIFYPPPPIMPPTSGLVAALQGQSSPAPVLVAPRVPQAVVDACQTPTMIVVYGAAAPPAATPTIPIVRPRDAAFERLLETPPDATPVQRLSTNPANISGSNPAPLVRPRDVGYQWFLSLPKDATLGQRVGISAALIPVPPQPILPSAVSRAVATVAMSWVVTPPPRQYRPSPAPLPPAPPATGSTFDDVLEVWLGIGV